MNKDFIIVGAGSAGCVVANHLVSSGKHVYLIEAGPPNRHPYLRVPAGFGATYGNPRFNWCLHSEVEPALNKRRLYVPRGKCLGGSGSINAMVYVRGLTRDFADWRALVGADFSDDIIRRQFEELEARLNIEPTDWSIHPLGEYVQRCGEETGLGVSPSINGVQPIGLTAYEFNIDDGRRASSYEKFYAPIQKDKLLTTITGRRVTHIEWDGLRARGVRLDDGTLIKSNCGVILCAGAIHSPQLLQVSGIGDQSHLGDIGITTQVDNPHVGAHLQDHLAISYNARTSIETLNKRLNNTKAIAHEAMKYVFGRKGALAQSVNFFGGFVQTDGEDNPDVQVYINPLTYEYSGKHRRMRIFPHDGICIAANPTRPKSEGRVSITTSDSAQPPRIEGNFLSHVDDEEGALRAAKVCKRIAQSEAFDEIIDGFDGPDPRSMSDETLLEDFRARCGSIYHPVGTCRMAASASDGVVDTAAKVYGVDALWVIDASIFPNLSSGNTNAPTMMLAALMAQKVLNQA